jgi:hypothetical protein
MPESKSDTGVSLLVLLVSIEARELDIILSEE